MTASQSAKKLTFFLVYIIFLLLLCETVSRGYWSATRKLPFFHPDILLYSFYPELKEVKKKRIDKDDGYFDILFLGGSVLTKKHGNIKGILLEELTYKTRKNIRVFNLSVGAHTSLDSYHKYKRLMDKDFDLVLFYHSINEVRTNNCPPSFFKADYSHYHWYKGINELEKFNKYVTFPFTFYYFSLQVKEALGLMELLPMDGINPELAEYGADIKTARSYRENIRMILDIAREKNEPVILMSYAYYVPEGYTMEKFQQKSLDYSLHRGEIEIWGKPDYVVKGIKAHNDVVEEIARERPIVNFVDQNRLIPKDGRHFNDICHLTHRGCQKFVENILDVIIRIMEEGK